MIRTEQTILSPPDGNCFAACVASILELRIDDVPNFKQPADHSQEWWFQWQRWLEVRNLAFVGWPNPISDDPQCVADILRGYSICTVRYEYSWGCINHAVVCRDGEIVWNPHPLRDTRQHDSILD